MNENLWAPFLVNFLFWSGLAIGALIFSALLEVTGAAWALPLQPIAHRFRRFLPVSLVIYAVGFTAAAMFRWRDGVALAVCYVASFSNPVAFLIVYPFGWSLIAIDVMMTLHPGWMSTLFPAYVFTANVFGGIAAVAVASVLVLPRPELESGVTRDLRSVLLGFALIWMYFTWTQFLVIWYGNLPAETGYVITRVSGGWQTIAWLVFATRCVLPAALLITRAGSRQMLLGFAAATVVVGFWIECWWLIVPALPGAMSVATTASVTAAFSVVFAASLSGLPRRQQPRAAPLQPGGVAAGPANGL
jgi:hypothetical protein